MCYPEESVISIAEISAEITLRRLLDHSVRPLVLVQKDVLVQTDQITALHLKLRVKCV